MKCVRDRTLDTHNDDRLDCLQFCDMIVVVMFKARPEYLALVWPDTAMLVGDRLNTAQRSKRRLKPTASRVGGLGTPTCIMHGQHGLRGPR